MTVAKGIFARPLAASFTVTAMASALERRLGLFMGCEPALQVREQVGLVSRGPESGLNINIDAVHLGNGDDHAVASLSAAHDDAAHGGGLVLLVDMVSGRALPAEGVVLLGAKFLFRQIHQRGPRDHERHRALCIG
jgi:hypothetical protein